MLYYVRRAFGTGSAMTANVIGRPGNESISDADIEAAHMILVTDAIGRQNVAPLRRYLESGGILLLVMKSAETAAVLSGLAGIERLECREADVGQYAMLDRIELEHPLLKPFSDPRFGDFTRIHFWKYRRINAADCPGARVLARFDSDDPAWLEVPVGRGSLLVWTSGWHPADSDLALSSKFVPLLYSALEYGGAFAGYQPQYFVGDPVPVPEQNASASPNVDIHRPDDTIVHVDAAQRAFTQTDLPGIYSISGFDAGSAESAILCRQSGCRREPDRSHAHRGTGEAGHLAEVCFRRCTGGRRARDTAQQLRRNGIAAEALAMGTRGSVGDAIGRDMAGRLAHAPQSGVSGGADMIEEALRRQLQPVADRRRRLYLAWRLSICWLICGLVGAGHGERTHGCGAGD